jgi:hypothetical protein
MASEIHDGLSETGEKLADRALLEQIHKAVMHLDVQMHEVRQFIDDNRPALARATRLLHNPVADYLKQRRG